MHVTETPCGVGCCKYLLNSALFPCLNTRQEVKSSKVLWHVTQLNSTVVKDTTYSNVSLVIVLNFCHLGVINCGVHITTMCGKFKRIFCRTHPVLLLWNHVVGTELLCFLFLFDCPQVARCSPLQDNQVSQCAILLL
jgi:hypothetical protein